MLNAGVEINAIDFRGKTATDLLVPTEAASLENLDEFNQTSKEVVIDMEIALSINALLERGANPYIKAKDNSNLVDNLKALGKKYKGFRISMKKGEFLEATHNRLN